MEIQSSQDGNCFTLSLPKEFNYQAYMSFHQTLQKIPKGSRFVLDFAIVETIDSAALGMLLLLREQAGNAKSDVTLLNCSDLIRRALFSTHLQDMFKIQ